MLRNFDLGFICCFSNLKSIFLPFKVLPMTHSLLFFMLRLRIGTDVYAMNFASKGRNKNFVNCLDSKLIWDFLCIPVMSSGDAFSN